MPQPARLAVQQRLWPRQCLWPTCDCPPTPRVAPAALWRALAAESWWAPHPPEPQARATPQPARQGGADRRGGVCGVRGVAQRAACGSCINVTQPLGGSKQPARMPRCIPLTSAASGSAMNSRVAVHAATSHTDSTPRGRRPARAAASSAAPTLPLSAAGTQLGAAGWAMVIHAMLGSSAKPTSPVRCCHARQVAGRSRPASCIPLATADAAHSAAAGQKAAPGIAPAARAWTTKQKVPARPAR